MGTVTQSNAALSSARRQISKRSSPTTNLPSSKKLRAPTAKHYRKNLNEEGVEMFKQRMLRKSTQDELAVMENRVKILERQE